MKSYRTTISLTRRSISTRLNMDKMPEADKKILETSTSEMADTSRTIDFDVSNASSAASSSLTKKPKKETDLKKIFAGVSLALLASLCFSISCVVVKCLTDITPSEKALFRYVGIMLLAYPVVQESREPCFGPPNWWWRLWILIRGICSATGLFLHYNALNYISLTEATIIMLAIPVCVFILARIFLGEEFGRYHVLALALSISGILLASNIGGWAGKSANSTTITTTTMIPQGEFATSSTYSYSSGTTESDDEKSSTHKYLIGVSFSLGAMLFGSFLYIMEGKLRNTHPSVILFNFSLISVVEITIINYLFYDFKLPSTGYSGYMLAVLAVISYYANMFQTMATQIEGTGVVSVVRCSGEAFFAFIFQIVFFHQIPHIFTFVGAVLVLASVLLLSFRKYIISLPDDRPLKKRFSFLAI